MHVLDQVRMVSSIVSSKIHPGQYEACTGTGTSIPDLILIAEKDIETKINIRKKEFVVPYAECLFAEAHHLPNMISIREAIRLVI